jgi:hypothetical protein
LKPPGRRGATSAAKGVAMPEFLIDILAALVVFGPGILTFVCIIVAICWFLSAFN